MLVIVAADKINGGHQNTKNVTKIFFTRFWDFPWNCCFALLAVEVESLWNSIRNSWSCIKYLITLWIIAATSKMD